jgi:tight adherence protein B
MSLLWRRELGRELLYGAGGMTVIGALVIRKIVNMQV